MLLMKFEKCFSSCFRLNFNLNLTVVLQTKRTAQEVLIKNPKTFHKMPK